MALSKSQRYLLYGAGLAGVATVIVGGCFLGGVFSNGEPSVTPVSLMDGKDGTPTEFFPPLLPEQQAIVDDFNNLTEEEKIKMLNDTEDNHEELFDAVLKSDAIKLPDGISKKVIDKIAAANEKIQNDPKLSDKAKQVAQNKAKALLSKVSQNPLKSKDNRDDPDKGDDDVTRDSNGPKGPEDQKDSTKVANAAEIEQLTKLLKSANITADDCTKIWDKFDVVSTKIKKDDGNLYTADDLVTKCYASVANEVKAIAIAIDALLKLKTPNDISSLNALEKNIEKVKTPLSKVHAKVKELPAFAELSKVQNVKTFIVGRLKPGTEALKDEALLTRCLLLRELSPLADATLLNVLSILTPQQLAEINDFEKFLRANDKKVTLPLGKTLDSVIKAANDVLATLDIGDLLAKNDIKKIQNVFNVKTPADRTQALKDYPKLIEAVLVGNLKVDADDFAGVNDDKITPVIEGLNDKKKIIATKERRRLRLQALLNVSPPVGPSIIPLLDVLDDAKTMLTKKTTPPTDPPKNWTKDEILGICFPGIKTEVDKLNAAFEAIKNTNFVDFAKLESLFSTAKLVVTAGTAEAKNYIDPAKKFEKTTVYVGFWEDLLAIVEHLFNNKGFRAARIIYDKLESIDKPKLEAWFNTCKADNKRTTLIYYVSKIAISSRIKHCSDRLQLDAEVKSLIDLRTGFSKTDEEEPLLNATGGKTVIDAVKDFVRLELNIDVPPTLEVARELLKSEPAVITDRASVKTALGKMNAALKTRGHSELTEDQFMILLCSIDQPKANKIINFSSSTEDLYKKLQTLAVDELFNLIKKMENLLTFVPQMYFEALPKIMVADMTKSMDPSSKIRLSPTRISRNNELIVVKEAVNEALCNELKITLSDIQANIVTAPIRKKNLDFAFNFKNKISCAISGAQYNNANTFAESLLATAKTTFLNELKTSGADYSKLDSTGLEKDAVFKKFHDVYKKVTPEPNYLHLSVLEACYDASISATPDTKCRTLMIFHNILPTLMYLKRLKSDPNRDPSVWDGNVNVFYNFCHSLKYSTTFDSVFTAQILAAIGNQNIEDIIIYFNVVNPLPSNVTDKERLISNVYDGDQPVFNTLVNSASTECASAALAVASAQKAVYNELKVKIDAAKKS